TRKLFANMKFRWAQDPVPLTPLMMAIAAGGNAAGDTPAGAAAGGDAPVGAAAGGDAADEANVVTNDAAGGAAGAPQVPQSPPPSSPETEWVVPDLVSPVADWRPWPYVHVHFSEPESPPFPPEQTFLYEEPVEFGPVPRPTGPDNYAEPEEPDVIISVEDDTIHDRFHVESSVRSNDAPKPTADTAGRAEDPSMLTILSDKLDRCMGCIATLKKDLGISKQVLGGAILKLVNQVKRLEKQAHLRRHKLVIADSDEEVEVTAEVAAAKEDDIDLDEITALATAALGSEQPAVPTENVEPMEEQEEMEEHVPNISEQRQKVLDALMMRMIEADWLNLMIQVGLDPTLARELLGADVNEENFIPRMNALKERKKRALADLRYRALQNKLMKKYEVTEFMRAFVKGHWCAAHNGTITMQKVRAMHKQQLIEEYEYICKRLENDRLLSAQHSLFRPKPVITEPFAKQQWVEEPSLQPATVFATSVSATVVSAAPDTSSLVAMYSAVTRRKVRVSPFADSAADASPFLSSIAADQIPVGVLFESTS
nr:hypothetical protein [Tanacetum cinerariifolium]